MKKYITITALAIFGCLFLTMPAQAGLLEFLFPSLRNPEADPSTSLQAPFADKESQAENPLAPGQLPENSVALDKPHRDSATISELLVTAVSEAMTFEAQNYHDDLAKTKAHFDKEGRQQYADFLRDKSILRVLESKKFYVRSFVQDLPILMNEGPLNGRYRWLYEVPMMLSYMDRSMTDYKNATPVSQKILLTVQVGRSRDAENEAGILIERWAGKIQKIDKK